MKPEGLKVANSTFSSPPALASHRVPCWGLHPAGKPSTYRLKRPRPAGHLVPKKTVQTTRAHFTLNFCCQDDTCCSTGRPDLRWPTHSLLTWTSSRVRARSGFPSRPKPRPSPLAQASLWAQLPEAEPAQPWSPSTRLAPADFPRGAAHQHGALSPTQALSSVHLPHTFPDAGHTVPGCAHGHPRAPLTQWVRPLRSWPLHQSPGPPHRLQGQGQLPLRSREQLRQGTDLSHGDAALRCMSTCPAPPLCSVSRLRGL